MSEARKKQKQNPFPLRLEAQLKAKALRFQPRSIMGARETLSRVQMNAQQRGALDSVSRAGAVVCLDNGRCRHTRNDISVFFKVNRRSQGSSIYSETRVTESSRIEMLP